MSTDGQRTLWRRNISENFNRLSRAHERHRWQTDDRQTTDGPTMTYSEHELEFTFAKNSGQIFLPFCHNSHVWQTGRQTEFSSLDRVCIPCSAVKIVWSVLLLEINSRLGVLLTIFVWCRNAWLKGWRGTDTSKMRCGVVAKWETEWISCAKL